MIDNFLTDFYVFFYPSINSSKLAWLSASPFCKNFVYDETDDLIDSLFCFIPDDLIDSLFCFSDSWLSLLRFERIEFGIDKFVESLVLINFDSIFAYSFFYLILLMHINNERSMMIITNRHMTPINIISYGFKIIFYKIL